ncbi:MAG: ERCC4 domain-containing protein, partial [Candidatus Bathyarchaeia archaeon]
EVPGDARDPEGLVLQHLETFKSLLNLEDHDYALVTGSVTPAQRAQMGGRVKFLTPQVLENDLITGRQSLRNVVLLVIDEAHRAAGGYAYVFVAEQYVKSTQNPLILALTASPGFSKERIDEIMRNLAVCFVEARTETSPDVKPYVKSIEVEWNEVEIGPVFNRIKMCVHSFMKERLETLKKAGFMDEANASRFTFRHFSETMERIQSELARQPQSPPALRQALSELASAKRASYAEELLETQGLATFVKYLHNLEEQASRTGASAAVKRVVSHGAMREAYNLAVVHSAKGLEHPKLEKLQEQVQQRLDAGCRRVIVFTNYRETAKLLTEALNRLPAARAVRFVGQADKPEDRGLSQEEQARLLHAFKENVYNVLVATQVAEEGIDVTSSDLVIFYDNIPSALRFIQRRGRTGRNAPGRIIILMAKNTRDEAFYWIARRKERVMRETIRDLQLNSRNDAAEESRQGQPSLETFIPSKAEEKHVEEPTIYIDSREGASPVVKELVRIGDHVKLTSLTVGDYVVSDEVAVERKTVEDFANSIIDKRLFTQARELTEAYKKPILILEGSSLTASRGVAPNALRGALVSLLLDFRLPVINTRDPTETALMLHALAYSEQVHKRKHVAIRGEKKPMRLDELQEYIVASLPNVEQTIAKRLLSTLGSVERVFTASEERLMDVPGIGETIAKRMRKTISTPYPASEDEHPRDSLSQRSQDGQQENS